MNTNIRYISQILIIFSLLSIVVAQVYLGIKSINEKWAIPSYDAYYFIEVSQDIQESGQISYNTPNAYTDTPINYPSSHPLFFTMISDLSGVEIEILYKYAGPVLFSILLLVFYILISRLTKNRVLGLIGVILLGLVPYNLYRSTMPLPETISLIFQCLVLLVLIMKRISWQNKAWIIMLFILGATYLHYRSIALIIVIVLIYLLIKNISAYYKNHEFPKRQFLIFLGICIVYIILLIPIIDFVFEQYFRYISPLQYDWQQLEPVPSRYVLPTFSDYSKWLGVINIIFGIIGFFSILIYIKKGKDIPLILTICIWFLIALCLTQNLRFGFYAPPYRFYSFFSIPLVIVAIYGIHFLINKWTTISKVILAIVLFLFSVYLLTQFIDNNVNKSVFVGFYPSDFQAADWLNEQKDKSITISYGAVSPSLGIENSEARYEIIHDIFLSDTPAILEQRLFTHYPNNNPIFLLIIHNMKLPMQDKYPHFLDILKNYEIAFEQNETTVYLLRK